MPHTSSFPPHWVHPLRFGGTSFLRFRPLTMVPIQTKMVDPKLMSADEVAWLDGYHKQARGRAGQGPKSLGRPVPSACVAGSYQPVILPSPCPAAADSQGALPST